MITKVHITELGALNKAAFNCSPTKRDEIPCPFCSSGSMFYGTRVINKSYKGRRYIYNATGKFCNKCHEGLLDFDPVQQADWKAFVNQADSLNN